METIMYKGYEINIDYDDTPCDPREWDNMWTMVCNHRRYNLWDEKLWYNWESFIDDLMEHLWVTDSEFMKDYIYKPLYLYDHSGISMNTWWFNCWWDSWQVWYIYVSRADAREAMWVKKLDTNKVIDLLEAEVECYDRYLTWQVYMWNVWDWWCGWYDSEEDAIAEAKWDIDYQIKTKIENHTKYIKRCIKSWVNILYRNKLELWSIMS